VALFFYDCVEEWHRREIIERHRGYEGGFRGLIFLEI
jgi:hypothetical protein